MTFDGKTLRNALGQFPTGVTVITAHVPGQAPMGMTANSFASVSLDPALVLWSIQKDSDCFKTFEQATHYGVNVLSADQQALSNQYAKKGAHDLDPAHYRIGKTSCPVLKNALVSFECKITERLEGGDHIILLGEVLELNKGVDNKPLVFHAGQYRELK